MVLLGYVVRCCWIQILKKLRISESLDEVFTTGEERQGIQV